MIANILPLPRAAHLTHPKYRADIDGLRALAVLSVVGFHAFPFWIKGGFIGVDIFFVISGFLISTIIFSSLDRNKFSFAEFYSRRVKRIFPALLVVLVACYAFGWFALLTDPYKQLGKHIAAGAGFVSNIVLWSESGYFDNAAETKPLLHLWSLGIEEQFYIIWPVLLWAAWKKRLNLLTIAVLVAVASFLLNIKGIQTDPVGTFYSPQTRFWELLTGSVVAWLMLYKQDGFVNVRYKLDRLLGKVIYASAPENNGNTLRNFQSLLGISLIAAALFTTTNTAHFPGWWALLPTFGTALFIGAGTQAWMNRTLFSNRVLVWFGLISFPLYLWHWPLLSFARIVEGQMPSREIRVAMIVASLVLAWFTYAVIEKPIRFGIHNRLKTATLVVLMCLVGYVGYNSYQRNGLGFRFPKVIQDLTQYKYNYQKEYREGTCFLRPEQDYSAFANCEIPADPGKKNLLLWGDSHAAHLYPGFKKINANDANIIELTASACPPILDIEFEARPNCKKINDYVFAYAEKHKPEHIVLSAQWTIYNWAALENTVQKLKKAGFTHIDLVGPVPHWKESLPRQLHDYFNADKFHRLPYHMAYGLQKDPFLIDQQMSAFAEKWGLRYISAIDVLCDKAGCTTRFGDTGDKLSAWDNAHLTSTSSEYLVGRFPK